MARRTKTFDCVEMKNRIQAQIMAEYEARKDEFASFVDFINKTAGESEWVRRMRKKFRQKG